MSTELILHPSVAALQNELEELRQQSSKLYLEAEYMQFEERPLLLSLYETNIGKLQFVEFQLSVKIRLVQLETQLVQAYINRNERPDESEIATRLQLEQEKFKLQLDEKEAEIKAAQDYLNAPTYNFPLIKERLRKNFLKFRKDYMPSSSQDAGILVQAE